MKELYKLYRCVFIYTLTMYTHAYVHKYTSIYIHKYTYIHMCIWGAMSVIISSLYGPGEEADFLSSAVVPVYLSTEE